MFEDIFSERLSQLRYNKNVSARDMSLSLGMSENYINLLENKRSLPSMTVFFYICEYFGITPKEFFETDCQNPERLIRLIDKLKKLDDKALMHIEDLVNYILGEKS